PRHVLLSVDTFHASVARDAIAAGADGINDTPGPSDPRMAPAVAGTGASLILTHSAAPPRRRLPHPRYEDVVTEVPACLADRGERRPVPDRARRGAGPQQVHRPDARAGAGLRAVRRVRSAAAGGAEPQGLRGRVAGAGQGGAARGVARGGRLGGAARGQDAAG